MPLLKVGLLASGFLYYLSASLLLIFIPLSWAIAIIIMKYKSITGRQQRRFNKSLKKNRNHTQHRHNLKIKHLRRLRQK